jgi:hypothetical protein
MCKAKKHIRQKKMEQDIVRLENKLTHLKLNKKKLDEQLLPPLTCVLCDTLKPGKSFECGEKCWECKGHMCCYDPEQFDVGCEFRTFSKEMDNYPPWEQYHEATNDCPSCPKCFMKTGQKLLREFRALPKD